MEFSPAAWWWVVAGVLVAAELATGTFYLLMLALGVAAAALAAHAQAPFSIQMLAAALVGGGAVAAWHFKRRHEPPGPPAEANRDLNLDIGEPVHVTDWDSEGNGSTQHRGARWSVRWAGSGAPVAGRCIIRRIEGNRLLVDRA